MKYSLDSQLTSYGIPQEYLLVVLEDVFLYPPKELAATVNIPVPETVRDVVAVCRYKEDEVLRLLKKLSTDYLKSALSAGEFKAEVDKDSHPTLFLASSEETAIAEEYGPAELIIFKREHFTTQIKDLVARKDLQLFVVGKDRQDTFRSCMYLRGRGLDAYFTA